MPTQDEKGRVGGKGGKSTPAKSEKEPVTGQRTQREWKQQGFVEEMGCRKQGDRGAGKGERPSPPDQWVKMSGREPNATCCEHEKRVCVVKPCKQGNWGTGRRDCWIVKKQWAKGKLQPT